jgi:hypothetical protein
LRQGKKAFLLVYAAEQLLKTALLRRLIDKPFLDEHEPTTEPNIVVNTVDHKGNVVDNKGRYLVSKSLG